MEDCLKTSTTVLLRSIHVCTAGLAGTSLSPLRFARPTIRNLIQRYLFECIDRRLTCDEVQSPIDEGQEFTDRVLDNCENHVLAVAGGCTLSCVP